ncbi:MAG: NAD(P)/FAD-dependent oxidoreductase [Myxococcaceae bacterium]
MARENQVIEAQVGIIGAGPAGTAAALHLGQLGIHDVVLTDREDFPRDKTCGSGLSPKGIGVLKALGVWEAVEPLSYPIKGLRLVTPSDKEVFLSGGDAAAAVICHRRILDHTLLQRAQSLGTRFVPHFLTRQLLFEGERVVGFRAMDGREIRCRYTIVADGAHSLFTLRSDKKQLIQAIMGWWDNVPFTPEHVEMVFDPAVLPWYGWLFPEGPTRVNIGICYGDDAHDKNARQMFQAFLDKHYAKRLHGATQVGGFKGHPISYSFKIDKLFSPGRVVIGEAGRMTHPATAEGIYQGMRTGMLAADALKTILSHQKDEDEALARYQWNCKKAFAISFWGSKLFHKATRTPLLDWVADLGNSPRVKRATGKLMAQM